MDQRHRILECCFVAALALLLCFAGTVRAQTTAFTYQGKLTDAGNPAEGSYDLQFKLYDTITVGTGTQQGVTLAPGPVAASAGIFTVTLDFGVSALDGADRYLEIGVRPAGSAVAHTVLAPRQPITSSPYAIQTLNAQQLGGLPASRYLASAENGNFGIGTNNPVNGRLEVATGSGVGIRSHSSQGIGVAGTSANLVGVFGTSTSFEGVRGETESVNNSGVVGHNYSGGGFGVYGSGSGSVTGVQGTSTSGKGVAGTSASGNGVAGNSTSGDGVAGTSTSGKGVAGGSSSGSGVYGETAAVSLFAGGVYGKGTSSGSIGVIGESNVDSAVGVYGVSTSPDGFGVYARNLFGGRGLYVHGPAGQDRGSGGLVKAMAVINANGTIARCYNGTTNATSGGCGFNVARPAASYYDINFGFQVDDRFALAQALEGECFGGIAARRNVANANLVRIVTACNADYVDLPFTIFVY